MRAVDFSLSTPAQHVVEDLLSLGPSDDVVIVHDRANEELAIAFELAALEHQARVTRIDAEALAPRPWAACPKPVLDALTKATASIACITNEEGELETRASIVSVATAARSRHVHMVGTSRRAFVASTSAGSARIFALTEDVRRLLRPTSKLQVRSAVGTKLEIELSPALRWFANGDVVRPGQWINVPFGSLVTSPHRVSGVYVADASMGGGVGARAGLLSSRPLKLTIDQCRVTNVEGTDTALVRHVRGYMASAPNLDRVGLLSLGTNLGIRAALGEIVHDENLPGLHIALGTTIPSRTGATWNSTGQLAFAAASTDVDIDGAALIRQARYVRFV